MGFTGEQEKAAYHKENISAAVSASAGSGKTAVLVEHIAMLISDKNNPADKIAAVTFTEKAAAELRQRIEAKVRELIAKNPGDEFLRDQMIRLSNAHISTISSFCLDIIRDNAVYLPNLPDNFKVCDETKGEELAAKALKNVLNHIYEDFPEEKQDTCAKLLGDESDIIAKIKLLHKFLANLPNPKEWKARQLDIYSSPALFCKEHTKKALKLFEKYLKEAENLERGLASYANDEKTKDFAESIEATLDALKKNKDPLLSISDFQNIEQNIIDNFAKIPPLPKLPKDLTYDFFIRRITEKLDSCIKIGKQIFTAEKDRPACLECLKLIIELEEIFDREFRAIRVKEGFLIFDDIEKYALEVLSLEECKDYGKNNFDYIIVDEFQDSNGIQYEIFKKLSKDEKNLYFVGDVKQSIYAFRNADPDIFAGITHNPNFKNISLNSNFRSSEDVIETVNKCLGESFGQYKIDWTDMTAARGIEKCPKNKSELVFINSKSGEDDKEILYTAKRIKEMVKSGFTVHEKVQGKDIERPCRYGDFAVLLRRNDPCVRYRKVFEECGIPCVAVGGKDFTNLAEVRIIMAVLEAILHPADDFSVSTAMMCPAYGFTADDITQLRLMPFVEDDKKDDKTEAETDSTAEAETDNITGNETDGMISDEKSDEKGGKKIDKKLFQSLYKKLSQLEKSSPKPEDKGSKNEDKDSKPEDEYSKLAAENPELVAKAKKFLSDMRLFRKSASNSVTEELIRIIYSRTDLDRLMAVGAGHIGIERRENMRLLLHYAKSCPVVNDFVSMINNISKNSLHMPQAVVDAEAKKMVKIMTIHASKGLQFPVVFLGCTNGNAIGIDKETPLLFDKESGVGIAICDYNRNFIFNTLSHQLLLNANEDREKAEELRLLYVALTRAEEKLIITAKKTLKLTKAGYNEDVSPIFRMWNVFSFFYGAWLDDSTIFDGTKILTTENVTPEADGEPEAVEEKPLPDFEAVKERLDYKYKYSEAVKTPAKFTATALGVVTGESEENTVSTAFYMGLPLFMKEGRSLTAKERGDLYHKVMEKIDFSAKSAEDELARLEKEGEITAEEKGEINPKEIQAFLDSSLCERARKAEKVYREFPLFTTINKTGTENPDNLDNDDLSFIQGIADMFIIENNEIILADYKTNRNTTEEKLIDEYKGQLKIYKKALEEMLGLKVKECMLFSFSLKKEIPVNTL